MIIIDIWELCCVSQVRTVWQDLGQLGWSSSDLGLDRDALPRGSLSLRTWGVRALLWTENSLSMFLLPFLSLPPSLPSSVPSFYSSHDTFIFCGPRLCMDVVWLCYEFWSGPAIRLVDVSGPPLACLGGKLVQVFMMSSSCGRLLGHNVRIRFAA